MKSLTLVLLVGVLAAERSPAQVVMAATARADLVRFSPNSEPTAWSLGLRLAVDRPQWRALLQMRGSPEKLGGWGSELNALVGSPRRTATSPTWFWDAAVAAGRPARLSWSSEAVGRVGLEKRLGGYSVRLAGAGMMLDHGGLHATPGLLLEGSYQRANLQLSAQLGTFRRIARRGLAELGDRIDTLQPPKTYFTRLAHGRIDVRWLYHSVELSGAVIRRSLPIRMNPLGYELGIAVDAVPGAKIRLGGGRMPLSGSNYLVAGNKLSFGVELSGKRRTVRSDETRRPSFEVEPRDDGMAIIRVVRDGVRRVEILGDFSDWAPIRLSRAEPGVWETTLRLSPGTHLICVRFDDGSLEVPEGLTAVDDEFGGSAGLLIVAGPEVAATQ